MEEQEFQRLLDQFSVLRPSDFNAELGSSRQSTSQSAENNALKEWQDTWDDEDRKEMENEGVHDAFWEKLKLAAERKVGAAEADRFCKTFQQVHKKLVYEGLSYDAAQKILYPATGPTE